MDKFVIYNGEKYYQKKFIKPERREYINIVDGKINLSMLKGDDGPVKLSKEILESIWVRVDKDFNTVPGHALSSTNIKGMELKIYDGKEKI